MALHPSASFAETKTLGAMRRLRRVRQRLRPAQLRASSATCWQNGSVQAVSCLPAGIGRHKAGQKEP